MYLSATESKEPSLMLKYCAEFQSLWLFAFYTLTSTLLEFNNHIFRGHSILAQIGDFTPQKGFKYLQVLFLRLSFIWVGKKLVGWLNLCCLISTVLQIALVILKGALHSFVITHFIKLFFSLFRWCMGDCSPETESP